MIVSVVQSFFPRGVLDEILNLIESVSEGFLSYSTLDYYDILLHTTTYNNHFISIFFRSWKITIIAECDLLFNVITVGKV